jgi:diguanylate cyclase (GGDEF)-like protein/PAS domain S-box-containing protein
MKLHRQTLSRKKSGKIQKHGFKQKRAIKALRAEIDLLHSYSTDTVYRLCYASMTYQYVSPNVEKLLGLKPEEMTGETFREMILEMRLVQDGMRKVEDFGGLEDSRKQGNTLKWQADYRLRTRDEREIWLSDISYPWLDEKGAIIGSVGALRDITDRVQAEEKLRHELVRMANTDMLTGLANRHFFFERLDQELKLQRRSKGHLSVMIIDVDHFKKINDRFGHPAGDEVLGQLSKVIQTCLRETDVAARIGGEEFGILLPDTSDEGAYWVADRIRNEVAKFTFEIGKEKMPLGCTVSIGVAGVRYGERMNATSLYKLADTRLYIAKHTGRNQVSMDEVLSLH